MKVGIIGAGTMGSGIAQAFAQTEGYEVYLCDINEEFAANGKNKIAKGLQRLVTKGKKTQEEVDAILAKITTITHLFIRVQLTAAFPHIISHHEREIGRASCRERV